MAEPTCLMQPFSYTSPSAFPADDNNNNNNEGNTIHAFGQSISFGRYMSENLSWERWSTFSHKRYVEEAERYTRPGSVAEKKAFFEAHYKKMAAKKAAALLGQGNSAETSDIPEEGEFGGRVGNISGDDLRDVESVSQVSVTGGNGAKYTMSGSASVSEDDCCSKVDKYSLESSGDGVGPLGEDKITEKTALGVELPSQHGIDINRKDNNVECSHGFLEEKPPLKGTPNHDEEALGFLSKNRTNSSSSNSVFRGKLSNFPSTPVKPTTPGQRRKGIDVTPVSKVSALDYSEKKKPASKSFYKSITSTPAKEFNRLTSTIIRKIDGSRAGPSKAPKDCSTPIKTPMAFKNASHMHPSGTPKRITTNASDSKSKSIGQRWRFLSAEKKPQSPLLSTPFRLRTEERAARRKQKLEDKFNADEVEKVQLQTKLKKKAETELQKLRQTLCFRARPLPDFYRERGVRKNEDSADMVPLAHSQTAKTRKKPAHSRIEVESLHLSQRPQTKGTVSKTNQENKCKRTVWPSSLKSMMIPRENTSPNIQ